MQMNFLFGDMNLEIKIKYVQELKNIRIILGKKKRGCKSMLWIKILKSDK